MEQIQVAPDIVPRLPVLSWEAFGGRGAGTPATLLDSTHIRYTTSGRAAIGLALQMLGVGPGDQVLIPTFHCPTMVAPAVFMGANPVFFPIGATGGAELGSLADQALPRLKVMIVPHYFGISQPMKAVREFCDRRRIALIEDCAHAIFGVSDGRPIGTWGDVAIASTPKFFATPTGGCLVSSTRNLDSIVLGPRGLASELRDLANMVEYGARFRRLGGLNWLLSVVFAAKSRMSGRAAIDAPKDVVVDPYAEVDADDPAGRFDPTLAQLASTRITRWIVRSTNFARLVARRRDHFRKLSSELVGVPGVRLLFPELPVSAVPYVLPVWVDNPNERYYALKKAGVPVFRWDWLWSGTPFIPGDHGRLWSRHIFQLPCHQDLNASDLSLIVDRIKDTFAAYPAKALDVPESVVECGAGAR